MLNIFQRNAIVNIFIKAESLAYACIYYECVFKSSYKQMTIACIIIQAYGHESCKMKTSANKTEKLCFWKFEKHTFLESEYMKNKN